MLDIPLSAFHFYHLILDAVHIPSKFTRECAKQQCFTSTAVQESDEDDETSAFSSLLPTAAGAGVVPSLLSLPERSSCLKVWGRESLSPTVVLVEWCSSVQVEIEWAGREGDGVGFGNGGNPGRVTTPVLSRRELISSLKAERINHHGYVMDKKIWVSGLKFTNNSHFQNRWQMLQKITDFSF